MSEGQLREVRAFLSLSGPLVLHHGMCVGADEEFCVIAHSLGARLVAHPCTLFSLQSGVARDLSYLVMDEKGPLERNFDIVKASTLLLATPRGPEERRSGTWNTIRAATKLGVQTLIFWPDGSARRG